MKKNYVFWIVAVTAILSLSRALGIFFTYSQSPFIHETGNFFLVYFSYWFLAAPFIVIYFLIKKISFRIILIPLIYTLMGLPFVYLTGNFTPFGGDVWDPLAFTIHLALAIYSFAILANIGKRNNESLI